MSPRKLLVTGASCLLLLIGATVSSQQARAGFLGDTLTGTWNYPFITQIYSNSGTGFTGPGVVSPSASFLFEGTSATVTDTQITETGFAVGGPYATSAFNGFVITDLTSSNITGVSIDAATNVPGFDASDLSFTSDSISINVEGLNVPSASDKIVLDVTFPGSTQTTPILPTGPCPLKFLNFLKIIACYGFSSGPSGSWYDPATASGYAYQMTNGSLFTEILDLPTGFLEPFDVTSPGCSIPGTFEGGQSVNFVALCGQGVSAFTITGIDPMFDPTDPAAFPIELAFNTATADFDAGALASTVPEPSSVLLLSSGMAGLGLVRRKRVQ
jgi:hypothetical protein